MIESKILTNEEIKSFAKQEDFSTAERYYEYVTKSLPNRANVFEKALSRNLRGKSVTNQPNNKKARKPLIFQGFLTL